MPLAHTPPVPHHRGRADLVGIAIAVAVGAVLAVVAVFGTASAVAGDGPGAPTQSLVSYDQ